MASKLPRNEKLEQLRREGKTRSTQKSTQNGLSETGRYKYGTNTQKPLPGQADVIKRNERINKPKRAKPYLTGEKFKGKVRPGQAAPAGKTPSGRKWERL